MPRRYFNRKWKVTITGLDGTKWVVSDSDFDTPLRVTFEIQKYYLSLGFTCLLTMWNLNERTSTKIIEEGSTVEIEAGYQEEPYGQIFKGQVFQPMFERENVTDFKTILNCIDGLGVMDHNIINRTIASGVNYRQMVSDMAKSAHKPISLGSLSDNLESKTFPRGKAIFGDARDYIDRIAEDNNALPFVKDGKLNLTKIDDYPTGEALVVSPDNGLIGTPQQTQYGVNFRCLMDPGITIAAPPMVVKIDNAVIRQMKAEVGQYFSILDQDGEYKVAGVKYSGDTRGNDWYVDVTGINLAGKVSALFGMYSK